MQSEWKKVEVLSTFQQVNPREGHFLGRPRRIWEDSIRMNPKETLINTGNWVDSAQDRDCWRALVNSA